MAIALAFFLYKEKYTDTDLPPGNYTRTCNDIQMSGNTLSANCSNGSGFTKTSYDTTIPCNYIQNINGTLECPDLPPGNYMQSCVDIQTSGNTLSAQCRNEGGGMYRTSYNTKIPCSYIQNINGTLKCQAPKPPKLPPGNYTYSCNGIQMSGNTLSANCPNGSGGFTKTSYDTTIPCNYIQNINGTLKCPDLPPGDYGSSCVDIQMSGNTLSANCMNSSGGFTRKSYDTTIPCNHITNSFDGSGGNTNTLNCVAFIPEGLNYENNSFMT